MFVAFSAYIKTITALTIFSTMACMFLPNNTFRKYLELILGIMVLSAIVQPLVSLFQLENITFPHWQEEIIVSNTLLEEEAYSILEEERLERTAEIATDTTSIIEGE